VRLAQVPSNSPRLHLRLAQSPPTSPGPNSTLHISPAGPNTLATPPNPLAPSLAAKTANWRAFKPTTRPTDALLGAFAAACAAQHVVIAASTNDKGEIEITKALLGPGAAAGVSPWDVVKAAAPRIFGPCTSVAAAKGADATNWSKFAPTERPTDERLAALTAACATQHVVIAASTNHKGEIEITKALLGPGSAAGVSPWAVVEAAAPGIFGPCTSVAAAKGADATHWSKFAPTERPTDALLGAFAAACAAQHVVIAASTNDKGEIEITKALLGPGAAAGVSPWDVVKAAAPRIFGPCTSVVAAKRADATHWSKFAPTERPTDERLAALTAACATQHVVITASTNHKGEIEITKALLGPGAAAGVSPWAVVEAAAPRIFGQCTSVAAAKGGHARGTMPAVLLRHSTSGCFLVASQSSERVGAYKCQKGTAKSLNANSWDACGITSKMCKTFKQPPKGFVVGTTITYSEQLYQVVGFSNKGWLPQWNAIVENNE
jgi:hypothetical protein